MSVYLIWLGFIAAVGAMVIYPIWFAHRHQDGGKQ